MEEKKRTKAEYRSSLRSKRLIREALISMMREKPFEKITITDIVRTADINRGTFYAHFRDISEVLDSVKELAFSDLKETFDGLSPDLLLANPRPFFESLSAFVSKDREYYRLILSVDNFRSSIMDYRFRIMDYLLESTAIHHYASDAKLRTRISGMFDFLIAGIMNIYIDVLNEVLPMTLEELPDLLTRMVGSAVRDLLEAR